MDKPPDTRSRDDESDVPATDSTVEDGGTVAGGDEAAAESQWRFSVDDVGPDGIIETERRRIEPEQITVENAVFVVIGLLLGLGAILAVLL